MAGAAVGVEEALTSSGRSEEVERRIAGATMTESEKTSSEGRRPDVGKSMEYSSSRGVNRLVLIMNLMVKRKKKGKDVSLSTVGGDG